MLKEANESYGVTKLVVRTGKTDLRYGIDSLCSIVRGEYGLNPMEEGVLYIFCGTRNDRLKALIFEGDGFVLLTKRLIGGKEFKWPRSRTQALEISAETYLELMSGCEIEASLPYADVVPDADDTDANIRESLKGTALIGEITIGTDSGLMSDMAGETAGQVTQDGVAQDRVTRTGGKSARKATESSPVDAATAKGADRAGSRRKGSHVDEKSPACVA